jgi:hypothetical protein
MSYNLRGGGLRGGGKSRLSETGNSNPMVSVGNIADAMLVLSVGFMVALVTYWNVSLPDAQQVIEQTKITQVNDVKKITDQVQSGSGAYNALGTVYQDPATGKLYMLTQDADKGGSSSSKSSKK